MFLAYASNHLQHMANAKEGIKTGGQQMLWYLQLAQSQIHKHLDRWTGLLSEHVKNCCADVSHLDILPCSLTQYLRKQINRNVFGNHMWWWRWCIPTLTLRIARHWFSSPISTIVFLSSLIPSSLKPRQQIISSSESQCLRIGAVTKP
jgi:hypothetical protein